MIFSSKKSLRNFLSKSFKVVMASAFLMVACNAGLRADSLQDVAGTTDQPFYFFLTPGKYPTMIKYHSGTNTLSVVLFGGVDKNGNVQHVKEKAALIENLTPIRNTDNFVYANAKVDTKYDGFREPIGQAIVDVLKFMDLFPEHEYKGTPFVDEYNAGLPAKWVFSNVEHFQAFSNFVTRSFAENNVVVPQQKPVLLIEIANGAALSSQDLAVVSHYFTVVDSKDAQAKSFYDNCQAAIFRANDQLDNPKPSGEAVSEIIFKEFEKRFGDFKTKEFMAIMAKMAGGAVLLRLALPLLTKNYGQAVQDIKKDYIDPYLIPGLKIGGSALAVIILYNIINKHIINADKKAKNKKKSLPNKVDEVVAIEVATEQETVVA